MAQIGATPTSTLGVHRSHQYGLTKKPAGMTVCTHLCRGNFRSSWVAAAATIMLRGVIRRLNVDGFFSEYDDERSGGFEPLRFVPKAKWWCWVWSHPSAGALENKDFLKRRIDASGKVHSAGELCLRPQCGFSSTVEGNALSIDEQIAKLS